MAMAQLQPDDAIVRADRAEPPRTTAELRQWVREHLTLDEDERRALFDAIEHVVASQRQLIEESKHEAIRALSEGFAAKMERLQRQLTEKDVTVSNIARYFEEVVADLTEKSHRDPKTKLLNFDWFMERRRVVPGRRAARPLVRRSASSISPASSGTTTRSGHAIGDRIIERVARILSDQIRSEDFLALERGGEARDLHARFGGDEFCFLIPDLPGCGEAVEIADRFKDAVEGARLDAATIGGSRRVRCASTSASSACASVPWPSAAAWRGSWRPS